MNLRQLAASRRIRSVIRTNSPPEHQVAKSSWQETSKLRGVNWRVRSPGPAREFSFCQAMRLARGRWPMATPLGRPVDPEV